jgi:hypothetical protein
MTCLSVCPTLAVSCGAETLRAYTEEGYRTIIAALP